MPTKRPKACVVCAKEFLPRNARELTCCKEHSKEYQRKYQQTEAYKEYRRKYQQTEAYREAKRKYKQSEACKESERNRKQTEAYKESERNRRQTEAYKESERNRRQSIAGQNFALKLAAVAALLQEMEQCQPSHESTSPRASRSPGTKTGAKKNSAKNSRKGSGSRPKT